MYKLTGSDMNKAISAFRDTMNVFSRSSKWYPILDTIFLPKKGFTIPRRQFSFDHDRFLEWVKAIGTLPEGYKVRFMDAQTAASNPVISTIWSNPLRFVEMSAGASLYVDGCCVSTCIAPMNGGGYAEIDIETHEAHRGRGYASIVATAVVSALLKKGLRPSWSTWPNREASQAVARRLGFIPMPDVPAYHWNEYECLPYERVL